MDKPARQRFKHDVIAIIYDFDGTLTPLPMQEYTVLPSLGIPAKKFWKEVDAEAQRSGGDAMLTYMKALLDRLHQHGRQMTRKDLRAQAANIRYFPGVEGWFERIDEYVRQKAGKKVRLRHYDDVERIPSRVKPMSSLPSCSHIAAMAAFLPCPSRLLDQLLGRSFLNR